MYLQKSIIVFNDVYRKKSTTQKKGKPISALVGYWGIGTFPQFPINPQFPSSCAKCINLKNEIRVSYDLS